MASARSDVTTALITARMSLSRERVKTLCGERVRHVGAQPA